MKKHKCPFKVGDIVRPTTDQYGWSKSDVLIIKRIEWTTDFRKWLFIGDKDFGLFEGEVRPLTKLEKAML